MILTVARVLEAALACVAIFVAVRSPRHRVFAAWMTLTLCYSLADRMWIAPVLGRLPRPFSGGARLLLHASQLLYIATHVAFASVVFDLARVRRILRPLPLFAGFVALVTLVDGYGHSPGPGLYHVASFTFRSRDVYVTIDLVVNAIVLGTLVPRLRLLFDDCRSTDDFAVLVSIIALEGVGILNNAFDLFHLRHADAVAPVSLIVAYTFALGFHVPVVYLHILGDRSEQFVLRSAVAHRREAIYEMGRRIEESRAAFTAGCQTGKMTPDAFPTASPLVHRARLTFEFLALVMEDRALAGGVDFVLSIVWGLGPEEAARLLRDVERDMNDAAARLDATDTKPFPWLEVFRGSTTGPGTFLEPIVMPLYSTLRDQTWSEARKTVRFARSIADGVVLDRRRTRDVRRKMRLPGRT